MLSQAPTTSSFTSVQVSSSDIAECSHSNTSGSAASVLQVEPVVDLVALAQLLEQRDVAVGDRSR